jgi:hypothetical protein
MLLLVGCVRARDDEPERRHRDVGEASSRSTAEASAGSTTDCETLRSAVNTAYARLGKATSRFEASAAEPADGEKLAATYDAAASDITRVQVTDLRVVALRDRYRDLFAKGGLDLREILAHVRAKKIDLIEKKRAEVRAEGREVQLQADMDAYCRQ